MLDYAVDWQLQDHAVLIVCEPTGEIPFVNVSYAGFVGSVTGMNGRHVSIGEMGAADWAIGTACRWRCGCARCSRPPAIWIGDLADARPPRTCQYYYVIADGNTNRAVGMEASWDKFETIQPGQGHPLLPKAVKDAVAAVGRPAI